MNSLCSWVKQIQQRQNREITSQNTLYIVIKKTSNVTKIRNIASNHQHHMEVCKSGSYPTYHGWFGGSSMTSETSISKEFKNKRISGWWLSPWGSASWQLNLPEVRINTSTIHVSKLVTGFHPSEKYMSSSVGMIRKPRNGKLKCSKGPSS